MPSEDNSDLARTPRVGMRILDLRTSVDGNLMTPDVTHWSISLTRSLSLSKSRS
jgi:hypothetical protein